MCRQARNLKEQLDRAKQQMGKPSGHSSYDHPQQLAGHGAPMRSPFPKHANGHLVPPEPPKPQVALMRRGETALLQVTTVQQRRAIMAPAPDLLAGMPKPYLPGLCTCTQCLQAADSAATAVCRRPGPAGWRGHARHQDGPLPLQRHGQARVLARGVVRAAAVPAPG